MEVLHEIIRYLNGRHLTPDDLLYLRRNGFIDYVQELELREAHPIVEPADIPPEDLEPDLEDQLLPGRRVGKSGRRKWRRTRLRPDVFGQRILAQWPAWQPRLQPLTTIAMQLGAPRTLEDALQVIRHAEPAALDDCRARPAGRNRHGAAGIVAGDRLRRLLGRHRRNRRVWPGGQGVRCHPARPPARRHGRVWQRLAPPGLRAPLRPRPGAMRHPDSRCAGSSSPQPLLLDRPLFRRGYEASCYWALTFIVSAIDIEQDGFPVHLHAPRRPYPPPAAEAAAVRAVARMAPRLMQQLLAADVDEFLAVLRCPCRWDQYYYNHDNDKGRMP